MWTCLGPAGQLLRPADEGDLLATPGERAGSAARSPPPPAPSRSSRRSARVPAREAAHRVLRPFLIAFYSIPKIALAPLIVMWFGLATAPKIILAATFVFFVVFMNMVAGVYAVNPQQANALRVMGAGRRALLTKLVLPGTVPYLMTGLRLAVPEALIGAVVGEFISANRGLGYLVTSAAAQFNTTGTMAAILALLLIVAVMDLALTLAERRLLRWRPRPAASVVRG
jgi:NitT/TauT family transport system permease protein